VFDIAGMTIRSSDQMPATFREAFSGIDIAVSAEDIQRIRGKSKYEAIVELLAR